MSVELTTRQISRHVVEVEYSNGPANMLDVELMRRLSDQLESAAATAECRCIVLCATGRHFCGGADLGSVVASDAPPPIDDLYAHAVRVFRIPVPIVAVVQGAAVGGGLGLALACDFRITERDSRFSANFVRLGFHQGFGLSVTLPRIVGDQRASELLLSGRRIDGAEAVRIGLCDVLAEPHQLRARAYELAGELATGAPLATQEIRGTLRAGLADSVQLAVEREAAIQRGLMLTRDFTEGVRAYGKRESPEFTGS